VPRFVDCLSLAFWTATAFCPTDISAVRRRAKLLMIVEACVSLGMAAGDLPRGRPAKHPPPRLLAAAQVSHSIEYSSGTGSATDRSTPASKHELSFASWSA
jgi:hypothetical protein